MDEYDVLIVGAGVVGTAIGYGLAKRGRRVAMLDDSSYPFRASLGNQGMVWRQPKGYNHRPYANLTASAVESWAAFADELRDEVGIDCAYQRTGGLSIASGPEELAGLTRAMRALQSHFTSGGCEFEIYDRSKLTTLYPSIGDEVPGAIYTPYDGICNPLALLKALHHAFKARGGDYVPASRVNRIEALAGGGFKVFVEHGERAYRAAKVVLAAGLGTLKLAQALGASVPIKPNRGQILVTERLRDVNLLPSNILRPNQSGSLLIGASSDDVGYDTSLELVASANIANRALRIFPWLANVRVVRMWSALRIMTPDGKPIYQELPGARGVFVATCHSGITLAPVHAHAVAEAIDRDTFGGELSPFSMERFDV